MSILGLIANATVAGGDANEVMDNIMTVKNMAKNAFKRDSVARKANATICWYDVLISTNCDAKDASMYCEALEADLVTMVQLSISSILDKNGTGAEMMKRIYNTEHSQTDLFDFFADMEGLELEDGTDVGLWLQDQAKDIISGKRRIITTQTEMEAVGDAQVKRGLDANAKEAKRLKNKAAGLDKQKTQQQSKQSGNDLRNRFNKKQDDEKNEANYQRDRADTIADADRKQQGQIDVTHLKDKLQRDQLADEWGNQDGTGGVAISMGSMEGKNIVKKYNNAAPSMITYTFYDKGNEISFDFGVKVRPSIVEQKTLVGLFKSNVKHATIVTIHRILKGKTNFFTDIVFAIDKMKAMAVIEKKAYKTGQGWALALNKALIKDYFRRATGNKAKQVLPWLNILLDASDYKQIRRESGVDIMNETGLRTVRNSMEKLMLLTTAIIDSNREELFVIKDGETSWAHYDFDDYVARTGKMTERDIKEVIKLVG